ncbi:YezD family protein [Haloferula sargassicola]|uniref:DUF2292 domain-containing protein n=1 Tax=Haloferula sargassicola TaxID=490096 RepID=A0ABP9ULN5_9BACT
MNPKTPIDPAAPAQAGAEAWLEVVREKVTRLKYGSVQITVHDGQVTQIESLERTRFSHQRGR